MNWKTRSAGRTFGPEGAETMKKTMFAIAIPLVAVLATGCGGDDTSSGSTTGGGVTAPDVAGRWTSGCLSAKQADGSTQYTSLDFDITQSAPGEGHWDVDFRVHGDPKCSTGFLTVHIDGPYRFVEPSDVVKGAWDVLFSFDERTVTPENDAALGFLQSLGPCGDGHFEVGKPTDVYTAGCAALGQYPKSQCDADHDLAWTDGSELRFGERPADNDLCTEAKRPTALSSTILRKE
jgi:hypothetical protein